MTAPHFSSSVRFILAVSALTTAACSTSSSPLAHDGGRAVDSSKATDSGFVCAPPDGATGTPMTFSGTLFDVTSGCLTGPAVTLPICGCFHGSGHDSSTWCFAAPDGTTYFTGSNDQCEVEMPPGWYAVQTFGPSPFGRPTSTQEAACGKLFASATSVTTGTYDRPGPPLCPSDGGAANDAGACSYPAGTDTYADASATGCRPEPGGTRCTGFGVPHHLLDCLGGPKGEAPPMPAPSLGCIGVPVPVPNRQYYCCPCAG